MTISKVEDIDNFFNNGFEYCTVRASGPQLFEILRAVYNSPDDIFHFDSRDMPRNKKSNQVISAGRALHELKQGEDLRGWGTPTFKGFEFSNDPAEESNQIERAKQSCIDLYQKGCKPGSILWTSLATSDEGSSWSPTAAGGLYFIGKQKYNWLIDTIVPQIEKAIDGK